MATADLTETLRCSICGATTSTKGAPFTKGSQLRGHMVMAHADQLVEGKATPAAPEPPAGLKARGETPAPELPSNGKTIGARILDEFFDRG